MLLFCFSAERHSTRLLGAGENSRKLSQPFDRSYVAHRRVLMESARLQGAFSWRRRLSRSTEHRTAPACSTPVCRITVHTTVQVLGLYNFCVQLVNNIGYGYHHSGLFASSLKWLKFYEKRCYFGIQIAYCDITLPMCPRESRIV